jgi:sn-glycerol 3-phosphate transport system permease protein
MSGRVTLRIACPQLAPVIRAPSSSDGSICRRAAEAAQVDGAGPLRFFAHILLPLSVPSMAALFVVLFIYGWNEYLWPLMITNTQEMRVVVIGLEVLTPRYGTELPTYNVLMAGALMALLPPLVVILALQRWFIGAIMGGEK